MGGSSSVAGFAVRGDLGWSKVEERREGIFFYLDGGCRESVKIG